MFQKALWIGCGGDELETPLCVLARVFVTCINFFFNVFIIKKTVFGTGMYRHVWL
jgi:hypothetical protein